MKQNLDKLVRFSFNCTIKQDEIWKEIISISEANERYFVTNYGDVISLCGDEAIKLRPFQDNGGYLQVTIRGQKYRIHRLVADAFCVHPKGKDIVHHKDHNKHNNNATNLVWATPKENAEAYQQYKQSQERKAE